MSNKIISSLSAALLICGTARTQDTVRTLNPVIITATKFPIKQVETGKVLTVISQEQLQKSVGKSIGEV